VVVTFLLKKREETLKNIVVIGGGIAGLSAGIFAKINGFAGIIVEKHHT